MARSEKNKKNRDKYRTLKPLLAALIIFSVAGGIIWLGTSGSTVSVDYRDTELIARGKSLFTQYCRVCHGRGAVGENPIHVKGGEKPGGSYWAPALNGTAHTWHHSTDALFQIVKKGSPARDSPMRAFGDRLQDEEIHALLAYVQSLWPEQIRSRYEQASRNK